MPSRAGGLAWSDKKKVTRRERFLAEMNAVMPWAALVALIAPHYPTAGRGRRPMPLETMLRIYFLQQWFDLSDPAAEDAIYDNERDRKFNRPAPARSRREGGDSARDSP